MKNCHNCKHYELRSGYPRCAYPWMDGLKLPIVTRQEISKYAIEPRITLIAFTLGELNCETWEANAKLNDPAA